jgi:hypothetical protein
MPDVNMPVVYNGPDQATCKREENTSNLMAFTIEIQKAVTICGNCVRLYRIMSFDQPKIFGSSAFRLNGGLKTSYLKKPAYYKIYKGPWVYGFCEYSNGPSDSIKVESFLTR